LVGGLFTFVSAQFIGALADRFGSKKVFQYVAIISIAPILGFTQLEASSGFLILLLYSVLFMMLSSGRYVPAMELMTSGADKSKRGAFMSLQNTVQQLSTGVAAIVASWIVAGSSDNKLNNFFTLGYASTATTLLALYCSYFIVV